MSTLKLTELRELAKSKNLPTYGTKSNLMTRLLEAGIPIEGSHVEEPPEESEEQADEAQQGPSTQTVIPSQREIELLRKERDLAAREAELLRRELELLRMSPLSVAAVPAQTGVRKWQELKDLIGEFSGNSLDFGRWEKQMNKLLATYNLDEHKAKALLCSRLTGKALKWYHSRVDCVDLSCSDLLRELKKMYGQRPDSLLLRREFEARTWHAGETFADYLHDKVTLANRMPVADAEIISYIIEGIPSQELRSQARVQCYETVDAMLTAFANVPSPKGASHRPSAQRRGDPPVLDKNKQQKPKEGNPRKCFNCNELGHFAADCTKPKRERGSCFKCGKLGHQADKCTTPKEDINCVTQERREGDDFQRTIELQLSNEDGDFKMNFNALIDSGSPISFVKKYFIPRSYMFGDTRDDRFYGVNGSSLEVLGLVDATILFNHGKHNIRLYVVPNKTMRNSIVLGRDFMKSAKLSLSDEKASSDEPLDIMNIEIDEDSTSANSRDMSIKTFRLR
ncbi:hypothetical protein RF55_12486 [Lasius niger]|uniref:Uncharacterized protein n=1 Tax=Lasius niger TaxID=67767 RepID=A0A0J7KD23_LASNI|nr:hypothetical protein RF55_12486 [Lasius niger]